MALTDEDYRALAREADGLRTTRSETAASPRSKLAPVLLIAGAAAGAVYLFLPAEEGQRRRLTDPTREAFSASQIDIQFPVTPPARTSERIHVEPQAPPAPPPVPALPPVEPPAPPAPIVAEALSQTSPPPAALAEDDSARRAAEDAERWRWERLRSPMLVFDDSNAAAGNARDPEKAALATEETDPNRRFLAQVGNAGVETSIAGKIQRIDALVAQGTMIRGVLETAINSDLPGMVRAQTLEDVWSFDGRRVLIPKGARLIGEYRSGVARGQTRVFIAWTRMLRADGVSVQLASFGADALGRSGTPGDVDNKYFERFGSAILLSVVGGAAQFIAGLGQNNSGFNSGGTIQIVDPATGQITVIPRDMTGAQRIANARQIAGAQTAQTLTQLAEEALKDSINIPPTIHVDQGEQIIVFVRRDLDFSNFYPDPVREALRELKAGRDPDRQLRGQTPPQKSQAPPPPSRLVRKP